MCIRMVILMSNFLRTYLRVAYAFLICQVGVFEFAEYTTRREEYQRALRSLPKHRTTTECARD